MPDPLKTWTVTPHGPLEKLEDNLWRVEQQIPGTPIRRVLTIVRLADGRLVLHNGIALDEKEMREIEAWGTPAFLIAPNGAHRLDAKIFKDRYPKIQVVCPPGAKAKVAEVVAVDATSVDFGDDRVRYAIIDGMGEGEGYLEVRHPQGTTLVLNDAVMNLRKLPGFSGFMMGLFGFTGPAPKVTFPAKMMLVKDKPALRAQLEKLAEVPGLKRVIVSHGDVIDVAPAEALRGAAASV